MITSRQNTAIKEIRSLSMKKYRDEKGLYLVESVKLVAEALATGQSVEKIFATEKGLSLLSATTTIVADTELVSEEVFNSVSTEVSPQGVLAVVKKPENLLSAPDGSCLFLDGVSDPANVGAIIRTAVASGYNNVYLSACADPFSPKSVRASMGGIFRVKVYSGATEEILETVALPIVVADMKGDNVFNNTLNGKFCLVIGNEGHGVSKEVKEKAKYTVSIPMENGMESLNAGVSAGILMYALKNSVKE